MPLPRAYESSPRRKRGRLLLLVERVSYREMFLNGQPPSRVEPLKGAGAEIAALIAEIEVIVAPGVVPDRSLLQAVG